MNIKNTLKLTGGAAFMLLGLFWASNVSYHNVAMDLAAYGSAGEEEKEESAEGALNSFYSMRLNEKTGTIDPAWVQAAVERLDSRGQLTRRLTKAVSWTSMGPDNAGGRTRALLFHKDSLHIMFMGAVSGGLWRSTSSGLGFNVVTKPDQNQHVSCIAQTADGTIYYGTGESGFANGGGNKFGSPGFLGDGIYKSDDKSGSSFTKIANTNTANFFECNSMVAHPTKDEFYVAAESGLWKFTDGGTKNVRIVNGVQKEVKIQSNGAIWVSGANGVVRKSDADGGNFQILGYNNGTSAGGRASIAISEQDENYVYLLAASSNGSFNGVYQTTDGGANWTKLVSPTSSSFPINNIFGSNNQGWWDNCCAVDPFDKNHIYMGGVGLAEWDPINGYVAVASTGFNPWNTSYVHADKHIITFDRRNGGSMMYVASDGGLSRSVNRTTWQTTNRNYATLQFYNVAGNYLGHVVGGTQDNGTYLINGNGNAVAGEATRTGHHIFGGDGFDVEFSKFNPSIIFMCTYNGEIARTSNGGQSNTEFFDLRVPEGINSDFNTTFTLWENDADSSSLLFLAKDNEIWVAKNATDFINDPVWFKVATGLGNNRIFEMDITKDGNSLFFTKNGKVFRLDNIQNADFTVAGSPTFNDIPAALDLVSIGGTTFNGRAVTSVNVSQINPAHVVVTLGGYGNSTFVYETKNGLDVNPIWKNITGNINFPVYDALVDPKDEKRIILGTEFGVFVTENGGTAWEEANDGMARVPVWEIRGYQWKPWNGLDMFIGTHGRGFYRSTSLTNSVNDKQNTNFAEASVFPNPAINNATLQLNLRIAASTHIDVINMQGQVMLSKDVKLAAGANNVALNTESLKTGTYFIKCVSAGTSSTLKMIKK